MKKTRKSLSILTAALLLLTLLPVTALAADIEMQNGTGTITPNISLSTGTVIGFAGEEWWVIGDGSTGVNPVTGNVTLLVKSAANPTPYGTTLFNSTPNNEYISSRLLTEMGNIATVIQSTSAKEYALITPRATLDGINGASPANQALWPLSIAEANDIDNATVRSYGFYWWLRSPGTTHLAAVVYDLGYVFAFGVDVNINNAIRPALNLNLNLTSVLFTSAASGTSGKSAAGGGTLEAAQPPTGAIKLTVLDSSLSLSVTDPSARTAAQGGTVSIGYTGAQTGTGRSVSVLICDTSGNPLYYGRPVDCGCGNASGTAAFTVPAGIPAGSYTLKIFNEEVNGANLTDFAGSPIDISLTVTARTIHPVPKTGDNFPFAELTALMVLFAAGAIGLLIKSRKIKKV